MKVLHIITSLNNGGAEGVLYRLCKYNNKVEHIVISMMDEGKHGPLLKTEGVEVLCLNLPAGQVHLSAVWKLFKLIRTIEPNVVQTWMYHADLIGGLVAKLAGVKNVFWNVRHTTLESGKSKRSTILVAKACSLLSAWVPKKIIYCAHDAQNVHEAIGYKKGKAQIIGNGYDLTQFQVSNELQCEFKAQLSLLDTDLVLGMVGRYHPQKDHSNLIAALWLVKNLGFDFKLLLVGKNLDLENSELLDKIYKSGLSNNVVLCGQRADIPAVMNALDIHILSSSFGEAFPNVLAEAMACGTPCVTTNVGDAALIVGETGWVVPPKQSKALAVNIIQAIEEQQTNKQAWLNRKKACRGRILENFSIEKMIANYNRAWFGEFSNR